MTNLKTNFIKDAFTLCFITLIAGLLLGFVYENTKEPIAISAQNKIKEAYEKVLSGGDTFIDISGDVIGASAGYEASLIEALKVENKNGEKIGYIMTTSSRGFGGEIKVIVGFDNDKNITGIAFPNVLSETPGLGMKITNEDFYFQYIGKKGSGFQIVKNNSSSNELEINAVTGATVSSNAINEAINFASMMANRAE
ncbi:MAG: FMN-binding protein [Eubacteriales bacterium]|nr:FMN-binding protein [Eubacteriales bacterium]